MTKSINGSLLPDEPIDNAKDFGFDDYSSALVSIIKDQNLQTPFTIAIHGDWGSGKTSLMKTVAKKLESSTVEGVKVKTVWFSAWEFGKLPVPLWTVFLNRVIMELQDMVPDESLKSKIKAVGLGILALSADVLFRRVIGVTFKDIEGIKERVWEDIKKIDSLREELSHYIEKALENDPKKRERLAIFIDDLDRCLPQQAVEIFESIKLFLSCRNCVFIVGVDKEQIRKAFEQKFGAKGEQRGLIYVEKFIQLQFDLPRKTPDEVKDFLWEHASEQLKARPKTIELISRFIEPNPRKIKRWINSVLFLEKLFRIKQEKLRLGISAEIDVSIASIWLFLKSFFPDFAAFVEMNPSVLNVAIEVASGEGSDEDKKKIGEFTIDKRLAEFLSLLEPNYDEAQLKDIVYLSRLTPTLYVSLLPEDKLKRIAEMTQDELQSQFKLLSEDSILSLADRIVENLRYVQNYKDYEENSRLFGLLSVLFESSEGVSLKATLFEKIFDFILASDYAYLHFIARLKTYTSLPEIRKTIIEKGLLNQIITVFIKSNSFEQATQNSAILLNFNEELTSEQIDTIVKASLENDQIYHSWGAQKNLKVIFSRHKEEISEEKRAEIKKTLRISF